MVVEFTPDLEQRLEHIASEERSSVVALTQSIMEDFVEDYEEHLAAVKDSDEQFERGEFIPHDEVVAMFKKHFAKA